MRLNGGRILRNSANKLVNQRTESRDAIVYDIDSNTRRARVRIQGSSQLISVFYPENWEQTPNWLKPGNAVCMRHTGGNRGRLELIGHGSLIPTPMAGETIPSYSLTDAIISGFGITLNSGMSVNVALGAIRVDGTIIDVSGAVKTIGTAHATLHRYDIIVVGTDGVIDVVAGTAAATPLMPATPADHFLAGWVLVRPAATSLLATDLKAKYTAPTLSSLELSISDDDLSWVQSYCTISFNGKDQYGNVISLSGMTQSLTITHGNGTITGTTSPFTYTRGLNDPGDSSPALRASVSGSNVSAMCFITLRDALNEIMF